MKRVSMSCSTIFSLPQELLLEILALVASSSFFDLFHAKLSCRAFNVIAESNKAYIYKQVSLEELPVDRWRYNNREQVFSFLTNCTENENPQALYRQGLVEYFNHENLEKGLKYIKASSDSCHEGASYIFGVIMACDSSKCSKELGMGVLKNIMKKKKKNSLQLRECREKFKDIMKHQWRNKKLKPNPNSCQMKDEHKMKMMKTKNCGWLSETEKAEEIECEECRCHWEVTYISNWLHGKSMYTF